MYHSRPQKTILAKLNNGGFGLIELLVAFSILVMVLGVVLVRQSSFNGAVLLRNQAYEIALHAREIQMFAVSVVGDSADYRSRYGLHFDKTPSNNAVYKVYRDVDGDFYYETTDEFGLQGKLDPRFKINEIRTVSSTGVETGQSNISVVFERPNFDARFFTSSGVGGEVNASAVEIDICVRSTDCTAGELGEVRTLEITKTGQISVQ
jgi:type II secretory pathway pseudopilin PulG